MKTLLKFLIIITLSYSCVQEQHTKTITFKVDMKNEKDFKNVGIRGRLTNPAWITTIYLKDENNDSIFEGTFNYITAQSNLDFKYVKNDSIFELQGKERRYLNFEYKPEILSYKAVFDNAKGTQIQLK